MSKKTEKTAGLRRTIAKQVLLLSERLKRPKGAVELGADAGVVQPGKYTVPEMLYDFRALGEIVDRAMERQDYRPLAPLIESLVDFMSVEGGDELCIHARNVREGGPYEFRHLEEDVGTIKAHYMAKLFDMDRARIEALANSDGAVVEGNPHNEIRYLRERVEKLTRERNGLLQQVRGRYVPPRGSFLADPQNHELS